jgi:hypothetical protein
MSVHRVAVAALVVLFFALIIFLSALPDGLADESFSLVSRIDLLLALAVLALMFLHLRRNNREAR